MLECEFPVTKSLKKRTHYFYDMPVHKPTIIPSYSSSSVFAAEDDVSSSKEGSSGDGDVSGFESYAKKK